MKKLGLTGIIAGAFTAAVLGLAGPVQAEAPIPVLAQVPAESITTMMIIPLAGSAVPHGQVPRVDTSVRNWANPTPVTREYGMGSAPSSA
jgi:hypothetical protein